MHYIRKQTGFTIVELLIVIVVIGVLAAVAFVAFNGVRDRATVAGLESDLINASKKLETSRVMDTTNQYPSDLNVAGVTAKAGVTQEYRNDGSLFCLSLTQGSTTYHTRTGVSPMAGSCEVSGVMTTFAGSIVGYTDGTGTAARFYNPFGIAVGPDDTLYVADASNGSIRMISPSGVVTTMTTNLSISPTAIDVDQNGIVYMTDANNDRIRKVNLNGDVIELGGISGTAGYADGLVGTSLFNNPYGIVAGADGNVYVADTANNRIRKITPDGVTTTLAGSTSGYTNANGVLAKFNRPYGITVDLQGMLYVSDTNNSVIRKIDPAGNVTTYASVKAGGIDMMGGFLYVTKYTTHQIAVVNPSGSVIDIVGSGTVGLADGSGTSASLSSPNDVTVNSLGNLFIVDTGNHRIRKVE